MARKSSCKIWPASSIFTASRSPPRLSVSTPAVTSAGGARAKAVIAFNPETRQVRSGQLDLLEGFEHWLIKFDGVAFSGDWGVADPSGYGLLEYSYYLMAKACGIEMMESRLFSENGRNHFMTRRFDREPGGQKKFVQTFGALAHFDYYESGLYSYEQLFMTMRQLGLRGEASGEVQITASTRVPLTTVA
ncbi:HipA domain-containing protein [Hyphomonas sp.]|uniref:HipA domain-containing protein n=1 Tax=Hyphomonas sp. TaxID=87 RepID=UPI0025C1BD01|nr:HipA domain-containing protein [Hyphomonas sp.]MBI1399399.1 hypothetical protein [Hyphomonas sp.]